MPFTYTDEENVEMHFVYNVTVKLSLCLTKHYAMKTYWGVQI